MKKYLYFLIPVLVLAGCIKSEKNEQEINSNHAAAMAVLYNYYSTEYKALTYQAYNIASSRLLDLSDDYSDLSSKAILVDIDETVLDNSPYQAKIIVEGITYPEFWNEWCNLAIAKPVPGAKDFLLLTDSLGYRIFYVSNRKKDFVFEATLLNLLNEGFPQVSAENLLLREKSSASNPDPSNKDTRRQVIKDMGLEIIMLVGDNLGDFFEDPESLIERDKYVEGLRKEFGNKFIVTPNAIYGNWPSSIGLDGSSKAILEKLKEMSSF